MRTRILGATKIEVSELALGTWGLCGEGYGPTPADLAKKVMARARALGVTLFDTSPSYSEGRIESELGEVAGEDEKVTFITRWGVDLKGDVPRKRFDREFLQESLETSKQRLKSKAKTIALLHNPTLRTLQESDAVETLKAMVSAGDLASWGVSASDEEVAREALLQGAPVLSLPYNALVVQPLRALSKELEEKETGLLVHSVLFYGLLVGRWSANKTFPTGDHRRDRWPEGALATRVRHLDAIRPLVSGNVATMRSAALRFALSNPLVHTAIIGPRHHAQLDQSVRDLNSEEPYLSEAKLSSLEARLRHLEVAR